MESYDSSVVFNNGWLSDQNSFERLTFTDGHIGAPVPGRQADELGGADEGVAVGTRDGDPGVHFCAGR